ncbi:hypothetical protein ACFX1Q_017101 [Malus domestica]
MAVQHTQVQDHVSTIGENHIAQGHVPAIDEPELCQPLLGENPINNVLAPAPAIEYQNVVGNSSKKVWRRSKYRMSLVCKNVGDSW